MVGPEIYDLCNSRAEIAFNDISIAEGGWYGVYLANGVYASSLDPGRAHIHHNHIEVPAMANGIWIDDFLAVPGEVEGVSVFAHNNNIGMNGEGAWGIVGNGVSDVRLVRNTISGTGEAGVLTGIFNDIVSGWILVLNDVSGLEADIAPIWLGSGTSDCWVLTKGDSSTVLDEGTDNHVMLLWW